MTVPSVASDVDAAWLLKPPTDRRRKQVS